MSLSVIVADIRNLAEEGETRFRTILDNHLPQAAQLADLIENNPIFVSVENALHVPPEILNGIAKALDALASAYPKPDEQAEPAPVEGEQQPDQPADQAA